MRRPDSKVSDPHFYIYNFRGEWYLELHYMETIVLSLGHALVIGAYNTWQEASSVCKFKQQGTLEELLDDYWR